MSFINQLAASSSCTQQVPRLRRSVYHRVCSAVLLLVSFSVSPASSKISLAPIFTDGAVLQRGSKVRLWGKGSPGESVIVRFDGQVKTVRTNSQGNWTVALDPPALGPPRSLVVSGQNRVEIKNVQVGDVWLCSGQSNMNLSVAESDCDESDLTDPEKSGVRLYLSNSAGKPGMAPARLWMVPDVATVRSLPALPYLVARYLSTKEKIPIGIICASASGAAIESFLPPETVARIHCTQVNALSQFAPSSNFRTLLEPYLKVSMRGVMWYQGESNILNPTAYRAMFPAFITDLRKRMDNPELPFYFVQLPNFGYRHAYTEDSYFAELRAAQACALALANVYMVVSIDTSDEAPLHPKEKRQIAIRLAKIIQDSGRPPNLLWFPPTAIELEKKGSALLLSFGDRTGEFTTMDKDKPHGFQIAGADRKFYWADALFNGSTISLRSNYVAAPVAARYAWADNPECNVWVDGQPLAPFRTDNWSTKPRLNEAAKP